MTSLLLRADASPTVGVGHLSRCVALATAARARGWDVALCGSFTAGEWLIGDLPVVPSLGPASVVVVDHYGLGQVSLPSLLVSIEDGHFGRRPADIVVDANLYSTPRPGSSLVLRGPAYAPLRAEIRAASWRGGATPPKVLVVMGGGAAPSSVAAAVTAVRETGVPVAVRAVSPVPVPGVEVLRPTPALPTLLAEADLVVSAAGVTLLELCCIGVPTALVWVADNQAAGYAAAVDQGLAVGLGADPRAHVDTLRALLLDADRRKALAAKARSAVDGRGTERILDAITARLHESPIGALGGPPISTLPEGADNSAPRLPVVHRPTGTNPSESPIGAPGGPPNSTLPQSTDNSANSPVVRAATAADSALLLAWRNDPGTRAWSRTTTLVTPAEHETWLTRLLADPDRRLLIAEHNHEPVGTVRFDRVDIAWEVSITVAPEARGRRLALPILLAAERTVRPATIRADVHRDNAASQALFRNAGYRRDSCGEWLTKRV